MKKLNQNKKTILKERYITTIVNTVSQYKEIEKVVLFGSWAMGNAKPGSDIDIALFGKNIDQHILLNVIEFLDNETTIPNFFDIVHFESISNDSLKKHIVEFGVPLFP